MTGPRIPVRRSARRGFTLMELIVSITILAAVSALLASLWSQTGAWAAENTLTMQTLRVPRVRELMRAQWADRRGAFKLSKDGQAVLAEPERLAFVTATPILVPDWPLVRAEYVIEQDFDVPPGEPAAWKLVYEETRLDDLSAPPEKVEDLVSTGQTQRFRRYILLSGMPRLTFERYGVGAASKQKFGSRQSEEPRDADRREAEEEDDGMGASLRLRDEDELRWRPYDEIFEGQMPAVRLMGEYEGEELSCLFVITGLR